MKRKTNPNKFNIGDCVKFETFDGFTRVGIIDIISNFVSKDGKIYIAIKSNGIFYTRKNTEIYPITEEMYVLMKLEN
jgi:hypothetical protein